MLLVNSSQGCMKFMKLMEMVLDTWLGGVSSPDFHSECLGRSYYHEQ